MLYTRLCQFVGCLYICRLKRSDHSEKPSRFSEIKSLSRIHCMVLGLHHTDAEVSYTGQQCCVQTRSGLQKAPKYVEQHYAKCHRGSTIIKNTTKTQTVEITIRNTENSKKQENKDFSMNIQNQGITSGKNQIEQTSSPREKEGTFSSLKNHKIKILSSKEERSETISSKNVEEITKLAKKEDTSSQVAHSTLPSPGKTFSSPKRQASGGKNRNGITTFQNQVDRNIPSNGGIEKSPSDKAISNKDKTITDKDTETSNKDTETSNKDTVTSNKDKGTSNKDTETSNEETKASNEETKASNKDTETSNEDTETSNADKKTPNAAREMEEITLFSARAEKETTTASDEEERTTVAGKGDQGAFVGLFDSGLKLFFGPASPKKVTKNEV